MVWVIIVVGVIIYLYVSSRQRESKKIKKQGGFYLKYRELIDHFYNFPGVKVEKKSNSRITLALKDKYVTTRYTIIHGFEDVSVFWNHQSLSFGNHSLKWNFPESLPQSQMIKTITSELEIYERNLTTDGFD